jgi:hypothetical protein
VGFARDVRLVVAIVVLFALVSTARAGGALEPYVVRLMLGKTVLAKAELTLRD